MTKLFCIRRDERWVAIIALTVIAFFQYLIISKFFCLFADYSDANWVVFMNNFHMSGYDPITYSVVTDWNIGYNIIRHPLLPYLMFPLFLLNKLLWWLTGINCVQFVVGALLYLCAYYSFIFLYRIIHDGIGTNRLDGTLLSLLFFGFAHVLVAIIVPDHFCLSLFLILLTLYLGVEKIALKEHFSTKEIIILFVLTAGVTLSNGVITGIIVLCVNGKGIFKTQVLLSVAIISILMISSSIMVNSFVDKPSDQEVGEWIDKSTSRKETLKENFFGESIQMHRKHILGDVLTRRPVFVSYTWKAQYVVEAIFILLLALGIFVGRDSKILQISCVCFLYALLLHIFLGFAIKEVYIMTVHWIFIIPIAIAVFIMKISNKLRVYVRILLVCLLIYLWTYHGILIYNYLTWPIKYA